MPLKDERSTSLSGDMDAYLDSVTSPSDPHSSRDSFPGTASSGTPNITMDEVVASAKDLSNLTLAHEIIVNPSFALEPLDLPQNSFGKLAKDIVHSAFWDILESQLNDNPPQYKFAIHLLKEIGEILLSMSRPVWLRTQITEALDIDLIRQQADNDAVDFQGLASYIISTMSKLCAPARDEEVKKLRKITDNNVVTLFKEIFRVLDLMKLDMLNFTIKNLRPVLQKQAVEYERATFQNIVDTMPNALDHTTSWFKSSLEELVLLLNPTDQTDGRVKGQKSLPTPSLVMDNAFLHVLTWKSGIPLPETLMTDETRLWEIQWELQKLQAVNAVLLIVYSAVGGAIQGVSSLADRLKRMTSVLLDGLHSADFKLEEALKGVSTQICCELNRSLTERKYPSLTQTLQASLTGQICSLTQRDNPIRTLVDERVQQYFVGLITAPTANAKPEQVPAGLTAIRPELGSLGAKFIGLVNYNKRVYELFYSGILRKLMGQESLWCARQTAAPAELADNYFQTTQ